MIDFPKVRRMIVCSCCGDLKSTGLVICWPCHREQKRDNDGGYSESLRAKLDRIERALT
jgi:hypothetical protein